MANAAASGFGVCLQYGDGASPEVFTTIAGITSVSGPNSKHDVIDVTDNDDVASNAVATYIKKGWTDHGQIKVGVHLIYAATSQTNFQTNLLATTARNHRIIDRAAATKFSFSGLSHEFTRDQPHDNAITGELTVQVTGAVT